MYISIVISTIIMIILIALLVLLHALSTAFPGAGHAIALIQMIVLISILILVHEAGHFFMAEVFKIPVTKFAFGLPIGPTLWRKKFGDVEILIHAFLFGGYVEFPDDDKDLNLPQDSPKRFMNRPAFQRFCVLSAGVAANVVWAFIFVVLTACIWGQLPAGESEIYVKEIVAPKTESVWQSGLQPGDKIISVNGTTTSISNALYFYGQLSKKNDGKVDESCVEQSYETLKKLNLAFLRDEVIPNDVIVKLPVAEYERPISLDNDVVRGLAKYDDNRLTLSEAQKKLRDSLEKKSFLVADGTYTLDDLAYAVSDTVNPITLVVERDGQQIELNPIYPNSEGLIGITKDVHEVNIQTKNFVSIIKGSTSYLWKNTKLLVYGLYQLFTGKVPVSELHGIIAITKIGGDVIHSSGMFSGLLLTAIISMDLAIMNFLPLPALDGGHVLFLIIEKIRGRKLEEETMNKIATAFFIALIVLMILVSFNDVYALITKKF